MRLLPRADEDAAAGVERDGVQLAELARPRAFASPRLDEPPAFREFHDARVGAAAMAIGDIDVAVGRGDDGGRPVKGLVRLSSHAGPAKRHEHLSVRAELDHGMAFAVLAVSVGNEHVAVAIDMDRVRKHEKACAEALHEAA
jgi:hypothetical protein